MNFTLFGSPFPIIFTFSLMSLSDALALLKSSLCVVYISFTNFECLFYLFSPFGYSNPLVICLSLYLD
jgi:hypothetical protein